MREITMDKNTIRETVRMIASDQIVISVVGVTVSRVDTLENYITVVGGKFLLKKNLADDSYVLTINAGKAFCGDSTG
jgi:hypothetical protein